MVSRIVVFPVLAQSENRNHIVCKRIHKKKEKPDSLQLFLFLKSSEDQCSFPALVMLALICDYVCCLLEALPCLVTFPFFGSDGPFLLVLSENNNHTEGFEQ